MSDFTPSEDVVTYDGQKLNPLDSRDQQSLLKELEGKLFTLKKKLTDNHLESVIEGNDQLTQRIYDISEQNIHRLMTELETGGNIRYEEGKNTDKWFNSCVELIQSRFNKDVMTKLYNIEGIQVTRVTRIHNRFLRNRFEDRLESIADLSSDAYKKKIEYLFYGVDPQMPNEVFKAMEEGFRCPEDYGKELMPQCVPLVNSILSAESGRIK